jgi:hypothetical protein
MKSKLIVCIMCFILCAGSFAQKPNIFIPINFLKAVEKGTRTLDGTPGPNYFQNFSDYIIKATFNPKTGELSGMESVYYKNKSPDTLKFLVVRLYPDLFKKDAMRQAEVEPEDLNDGVELQSVSVNNNVIDVSKLKHYGTNVVIPLVSKLQPRYSLTLDIKWKVKLPLKTQLRMGKYDSTSYFVAYWYPQIAVYDDISGWCMESYTGLQEFYNDFAGFDVEITVPAGNVVWATGELLNGKDLFTDEINKKIVNAVNSDEVVPIITAKDYDNKKVLKSGAGTTWHFMANDVTDFVFAVSDHYVWDGVGLEVDALTKRRTLVNAIYKKGSTAFTDVAEIARRAIERYSTDIIGVPYPYPHMTVFEGAGGMEYPMMVNDEPFTDKKSEVFVTCHEIFHTYFPFMVGTNETLYGWIDEALATFMPKEIEIEYGNDNAHYYIASYSSRAMGTLNDVPLLVPSTNLSQANFMMQNYGRAAAGFYFLSDMLGKDVFRDCIKEFIERWKGKHPTPTDLLFTFNAISKQDISWFWNAWFYEYGYADLALENVVINKNNLKLNVVKKGSIPVPVKLDITLEDGSLETIYQSALIWKDKNVWTLEKTFGYPVLNINLGDKNIPDAFKKDNVYSK